MFRARLVSLRELAADIYRGGVRPVAVHLPAQLPVDFEFVLVLEKGVVDEVHAVGGVRPVVYR